MFPPSSAFSAISAYPLPLLSFIQPDRHRNSNCSSTVEPAPFYADPPAPEVFDET